MPQYTDICFSEQLKKFRIYRGYKTQAVLCKRLNISRQVWSLWELNKRKPTIPQLLTIANCLKVDLGYFFITDAAPEDFDLHILCGDRRPPLKGSGDSLLMPFQETTPSRQLFRIMDQCRSRKGAYTLTMFPDSGTSRAIREYCALNPQAAWNRLQKNSADQGEIRLLIFDDADKLPVERLKQQLDLRAPGSDFTGSLVFCGKKIREILGKAGLAERIDTHFYIDCITTADFDRIARGTLGGAGESVLNLLRLETGLSLKRLEQIAILIGRQKKRESRFMLTINTLIKLFNQL